MAKITIQIDDLYNDVRITSQGDTGDPRQVLDDSLTKAQKVYWMIVDHLKKMQQNGEERAGSCESELN